MKKTKNEEIEELLEFLQELREEIVGKQVVMVVEGKKDKLSLEEIGFKGTYLLTNGSFHRTNYLMEKYIEKGFSFLILSDFDEEGEKIKEEVINYIDSRAEVRLDLRRKLKKVILNAKAPCTIESLSNWLIKRRVGGRSEGGKGTNKGDVYERVIFYGEVCSQI